ncbi:hypothetical protein GP475_01930 [Corynebacterium poyangense]|uniref:Uncharacterized protein n=1 Tax=Corynebacterium poyangense TaxID=2684405 RepID=A0A7H0SLV4_9CORY|nr:hypothetical protein [Corynebacterium poyangense]MBZ8177636.1 hypothetical protein [Corynebacterium poyangense]QNQ89529.1 hypothetical protein GP475_01930 [Corynebacterium poyangense]
MNQGNEATQRPEAVQVFTRLWGAVICAEVLHQLISLIMGVLDSSQLRAQLKKQAADSAYTIPEHMFPLIIALSLGMMLLLSLLILGLLGYSLTRVHLATKYAAMAHTLLSFFGLYFTLRMVLLYFASPQSSVLSVGWYLVDGSVQIIIGVMAALTLYFGRKEDTLRWTGEWQAMENMRKGGK